NAESYNPNIHSQYLRARYYDTVKGSFLTEDTYLGDIRKPLTRNRYSYCIGNPLFYCDPSGHAPQNVIDQVVIDFLEDTKNSRLHDYDLYEAYNARLEFYDILDQEGIWDRMGRSTEEQRISYMKKYNFAKSGLNVKKWVDEAKLQAKKYGCEEMRVSSQGIEMIANFELSKGAAEAWEIGEFDENGELIGIYPHYVFKEVNGKFQSDGGITFGYGHIVSQWDYDNNSNEKTLADKYAFGAIFKPEKVPNDGVPYKVPDSSYMPIEEAKKLMMPDIEKCETALNDFLLKNGIKLNQNQFDALISFSYQYGENWWTKEEKKLPEFLLGGKGTYDEEEVRRVFALHDNKDRRAIEAEVFINGYK
ncbi:MAG: hypothetical protein K2P64_05855, partial [Lachnospiraceae bacterium]|nr:hypothetical protein [Lachnospiraceae bacterium]